MNHLTPHELAEAADASSDAQAGHPHLSECETCRLALEDLRALLSDAHAAGEVPEPSPLFWDHFAARVRAATVDAEIPVRPSWWALWKPAFALAAMLVVAVIGWRMAGPDPESSLPAAIGAPEIAAVDPTAGAPEPLPAESPVEPAPVEVLAEAEPPADEDWLAAAGLSEALAPESVSSLATPGPDVFLAEELTSRELQEFARLLRAQMGGVQ